MESQDPNDSSLGVGGKNVRFVKVYPSTGLPARQHDSAGTASTLLTLGSGTALEERSHSIFYNENALLRSCSIEDENALYGQTP